MVPEQGNAYKNTEEEVVVGVRREKERKRARKREKKRREASFNNGS